VDYDGRRYTFVEYKGQNQPEIELNGASHKSNRIFDLVTRSTLPNPSSHDLEFLIVNQDR
jgi:hypothetical protein